MSYHYVSVTDLKRYVRMLRKHFITPTAFLEEVEESIRILNQYPTTYVEEIRFYERVKERILTDLIKEKVGKKKKNIVSLRHDYD